MKKNVRKICNGEKIEFYQIVASEMWIWYFQFKKNIKL